MVQRAQRRKEGSTHDLFGPAGKNASEERKSLIAQAGDEGSVALFGGLENPVSQFFRRHPAVFAPIIRAIAPRMFCARWARIDG